MADTFAAQAAGLDSPADNAIATPASDSVDLTNFCRAIWVATGGSVKVTTVAGQTVTFTGVPDGFILPVRCSRIWSTGTTAPTTLIALF